MLCVMLGGWKQAGRALKQNEIEGKGLSCTYWDGSRGHATSKSREQPAHEQHPDPLGAGHEEVSEDGRHGGGHDAQLSAQAVVAIHSAQTARSHSQGEDGLRHREKEREFVGNPLTSGS